MDILTDMTRRLFAFSGTLTALRRFLAGPIVRLRLTLVVLLPIHTLGVVRHEIPLGHNLAVTEEGRYIFDTCVIQFLQDVALHLNIPVGERAPSILQEHERLGLLVPCDVAPSPSTNQTSRFEDWAGNQERIVVNVELVPRPVLLEATCKVVEDIPEYERSLLNSAHSLRNLARTWKDGGAGSSLL